MISERGGWYKGLAQNALLQPIASVAASQSSIARRHASQQPGRSIGLGVQLRRHARDSDFHIFKALVQVKELIGRGRGLVAARPIPRGTTVIYEKPLIAVKKKPGVDLEIWKQYKQLSKEERKFYDSLGPDKANKQEMVASIFWEHCVKLGSEDLRAMYSRYHLCSTSQ